MIKLNLKNAFKENLSEGLSESDLKELEAKFSSVQESFTTQDIGFKELLNDYDSLRVGLETAQNAMLNFKSFVVIGVGGSDQGTKTIVQALKNNALGREIFFAGDTTDPDAISELLTQITLESTLFLVVSKSGNTIEQGSLFVYLRQLVIESLGRESLSKHFIFLTDPVQGTLKAFSRREGYRTIDIPQDVGGRFSVLSSVGMVPSHLLGLNVEKFLEGARSLDLIDPYRYALVVFWYYKNGKDINVIMPYKSSLSNFSRWYQQLFAESLGKKFNSKGNEVFEGITPVVSIGPADQHSILQLLNEGPNDKVTTFVSVDECNQDLKLPENYEGIDEYSFFSGKTFNQLLKLEIETTSFALTKNKRPNIEISIPQLDEYHLGQLFYFFQVTVTYLGFLMDIDPFDQPGVELSKNAMYGILGKEGFSEFKKDFDIYKL